MAAQRVLHSILHMRTHVGRMHYLWVDVRVLTDTQTHICMCVCRAPLHSQTLSPAHPYKEGEHCSTWIFSGSCTVLLSFLEVKGKRNAGTVAKNGPLCP